MKFLFGFSGRMGRGGWWLGQLVCLLLVILAVAVAMFAFAPGIGRSELKPLTGLQYMNTGISIYGLIAFICIVALAVWANIAVTIKRFHDRGKPGVWFLIMFVPYIGTLWQIVECGVLRGTDGPNDYDAPGRHDYDGWDNHAARPARPTSRMAAQDTRPAQAPPQMSARRPTGPAGFGKRGQ